MCRQGGYFDQAAYLARKHTEHGLVVDILVEDCNRYEEALAYIWRLDAATAYESLMKYATVLLEHCPTDTTQIFIEYFTGRFRPKKDAIVLVSDAPTQGGIARAATAVQNLAAMIPLPYMGVNQSQTPTSQMDSGAIPQEIEAGADEPLPEYDVPKPRAAFSSFVDHPQEFVQFLEACAESPNILEGDKVDLYTTLFEMYLNAAASSKADDGRREWELKAKALIESKKVPLETSNSNVLLLSDLSNFRDGTILVREKQGLRFDIFRSYTSAKDTAGAIKALRKYGPEEPQLYPAALAYFTSSARIIDEAGDELDVVLKKIDDDGLMAPLQVVQTLSINGVASMGMIKRYLSNTIERERREIAVNRHQIQAYRTDTEKKTAELAALASKPQTFNATRCATCGMTLDLPTVHFLCKHSVHQRCLNVPPGEDEGKTECPLCAGNNATVRLMRKTQVEMADRHELFAEDLGRSKDKFGRIAEWFGRGVI